MPPLQITRREWAWVALWSAAIVALTLLPGVYAAASTPPGLVFSGLLVNARDGNSYLAKMEQGYAGAWLYRIPYTPEEQRGVFVYTLYLALGHLARLFRLPLVGVFHGARVFFGWLLLLMAYRFSAELAPDVSRRRLAYWLVAVSSGFGWLAIAFGRETVDLSVPEAISFYSLLPNPHFPLSMALMLAGVLAVYRPLGRRPYAAVAGCGAALALIAPYAVPVTLGTLGGTYALIYLRQRRWDAAGISRLAVLAGATLPFLVYDAISLWADPAVKAWAAQNITPSPPPLDYLLGYGLLLPLAAVGAWRVWKEGAHFGQILIVWVIVTAVLVYLPIALQRRFVTGLHVPVAILAGAGLAGIVNRSRPDRSRPQKLLLLGGIFALVLPSNILIMAALFQAPRSGDPYVYRSQAEWAGMRWIRENTPPDAVVLAGPVVGNFIPAVAGRRVVYGHPFETIGAANKKADVEAFFEGRLSVDEMQALLRAYHVTHVFVGALEREAAGSPDELNRRMAEAGLRLAFSSGQVAIYDR